MPSTPVGIAYLLTTLIFASIAAATWRRRASNATIAVSLTVVMAAAGWWSITLAVAAASPSPRVAAFATIAAFPGPSVMVAAFVALGLGILWPQWTPTRRVIGLLLLEPALISAAALTNPWHQLVYRGPGAADLIGAPGWTYGPVFWIDSWFGYLSVAVGTILIARSWWTASPAFRRQRLALLFAALIPALVNGAFLAGGFGDLVDPTLFGFAATGIVMAYVIFQQDLFTFTPVARSRLIDQIGDAIVVVSPTGRILDLNPAAAGLVRGMNRHAPQELIGATVRSLFEFGLTIDRTRRQVTVDLASGGRAQFHVRASPLVDGRGSELGTVLVARNVTESNAQTRRLFEANTELVAQLATIDRLRGDLVQLSNRDPLTGLHNRRYLVEQFGPIIDDARRTGAPVAVVLVDIDRFKAINDEHGHLAGDKVLVAVAQRLREQAPAGSLVARWGGEEFFVVLPRLGADDGLAFAEEVRHRCERHRIAIASTTVRCTLSGGVAVYPESGSSMTDLFHAADLAMYDAKRAGRNVVRLHEPAVGSQIDAATG